MILAFTTFRDTKLLPALLALHSVHVTGLGGGYTRRGAIVYIFDWREVDDAIEMIGNMLAQNGFKDEVTIVVAGIPVNLPSAMQAPRTSRSCTSASIRQLCAATVAGRTRAAEGIKPPRDFSLLKSDGSHFGLAGTFKQEHTV